MKRGFAYLVFSVTVTLLAADGWATDYYVNGSCGNNGWNGTSSTCSSPNGPKDTIQAGLNLGGDGDVIHVASGTYAGSGNVNLTFPGKRHLLCDGAIGSCEIDAQGARPCIDTSTDVRGLLFQNDGCDNTCIVEGFTIKNGCRYGSETAQYGGGILIDRSEPTIRNCIIRDNHVNWAGGGIAFLGNYPTNYYPLIEGCEIRDNQTLANHLGGGGMYVGAHVDPLIKGTTVKNNTAAHDGGGMYWDIGADIRLEDCIVEGNTVTSGSGGGIYITQVKESPNVDPWPYILRSRIGPDNATTYSSGLGGGIRIASVWGSNDKRVSLSIVNSTIIDNHADGTGGIGGGLSAAAGVPEYPLELKVANTVFAGNSAKDGGALHVENYLIPRIDNVTLMHNTVSGSLGGSALYFAGLTSGATINNSILWYDSSAPAQPQIRLGNGSGDGKLTLNYSAYQYQGSLPTQDIGFYNIISTAPTFVDADGVDNNRYNYLDNNYQLQVASAGVNEGSTDLLPEDELDLDEDDEIEEPLPLDLADERRIIGAYCAVDTGAYEYQFNGCPPSNAIYASPSNGKVDARRPHLKSTTGTAVSLGSREGIGGSGEPITILLHDSGNPVCGATDPACWELCETGLETVESPTSTPPENDIATIIEVDDGEYEIVLDRPISGGHYTSIEYAGGGMVTLASLPSDVNFSGIVTGIDILDFIDCCYNSVCLGYDDYRCDLNRSGGPPYDDDNDADYFTMLDLVNGYGNFIPWFNAELPEENECEGESLMGGGGGEEFTNSDFTDWLVNFISTADPVDSQAEDRVNTIVSTLTQWCLNRYTSTELADLVDALADPKLEFASSVGQNAAAAVVEAIGQ